MDSSLKPQKTQEVHKDFINSYTDIRRLGASSGIGLATVKEFSASGAHIVAADLNPLPQDISNEVIFRKTDLGNWNEQVELFELAVSRFGHIDIVFLNAGIYEIEDLFVDKFDEKGRLREPEYSVLKINLLAQIAGTKLAIHHLRKQPGGGAIVITGSGKCTMFFSKALRRGLHRTQALSALEVLRCIRLRNME